MDNVPGCTGRRTVARGSDRGSRSSWPRPADLQPSHSRRLGRLTPTVPHRHYRASDRSSAEPLGTGPKACTTRQWGGGGRRGLQTQATPHGHWVSWRRVTRPSRRDPSTGTALKLPPPPAIRRTAGTMDSSIGKYGGHQCVRVLGRSARARRTDARRCPPDDGRPQVDAWPLGETRRASSTPEPGNGSRELDMARSRSEVPARQQGSDQTRLLDRRRSRSAAEVPIPPMGE